MDVRQVIIIIFGLVLALAWTSHGKMSRCYEDGEELREAAARKLRTHYPQPPQPATAAAGDAPAACPVALYRHLDNQQLSDRSLSPWRYVLKTKEDHFPSTYAEAQCLCSGCILIQGNNPPKESPDYNSVPIKQSRVFLRRELCDDEDDDNNNNEQKYILTPVSVEVTVGCTCARAKSSS